MAFDNKPIFDVVRGLLKKHNPEWVTFTPAEIKLLDEAILVARGETIVPVPVPTLPSTTDDSGFVLSQFSKDNLSQVHPKLKQCVELAIKYSKVDFRVQEGMRTLAKQKEYFNKGTTRTMNSKHLRQADGNSWAVDLVAFVNGKVSWNFDEYYYIARAMDRAATELKIANHVRWGAVWDRVLSDFGTENNTDKVAIRAAYLAAVTAYKKRHAGSDFLDGPHFEWVA